MDAPDSDEILKQARRHFQHGHRPIPVYWRADGGVQPIAPYSDFFTNVMTERAFKELFLDKKGKLKHEIEGFGILTCKDTGVLGWDIDAKGDDKPDGFQWLKFKKLSLPNGMITGTPHNGMHITQNWPDDVDHLPTKDLGHLITGLNGDEHRAGVEIKGRDLFIVCGPGYTQETKITSIRPADGPLLELVLDHQVEWVEESYADELGQEQGPSDEPLPDLGHAIPRRGYLHDFVEHLTRSTMVAPEFALAVGLTQLSTIMAGRIAVKSWTGNPIKSHVWLILVGPPATFKTSALEIGFRMVDEATNNVLTIPVQQTPESLLDYLANKRSRGYMFHSNFGGFMARSAGRSYQAGDKVDLEEMFDSPSRYQKRTKTGGEITIRRPSFVMAGGLTRSDFERYIREEDMLGGFLTRMLFVMLESKRTDVRGLEDALVSEPERRRLTERLTELYEMVKAQRKPDTGFRQATEVEVTQVAMQELDKYTRRIREMDVDSVLFGFRNRLGQYTLKLAMGYGLSRTKQGEELKVMGQDIRHAISFLEYQRTRAWPVVLDVAGLQDKSARQLWKVRTMLQQLMKETTASGGDWTETWVNLRLLHRRLHMTIGAFGVFKDSLLETGQVKIRTLERPFVQDRLGRRASGRGQIQITLTPAGWISDMVA